LRARLIEDPEKAGGPTGNTVNRVVGLRASPEQRALLRRAAQATGTSLSAFILDNALSGAGQTLTDHGLREPSPPQPSRQDALEQSTAGNEGLQRLFARTPPWCER
jgi:uncharacterized protein (DUF1778 family)